MRRGPSLRATLTRQSLRLWGHAIHGTHTGANAGPSARAVCSFTVRRATLALWTVSLLLFGCATSVAGSAGGFPARSDDAAEVCGLRPSGWPDPPGGESEAFLAGPERRRCPDVRSAAGLHGLMLGTGDGLQALARGEYERAARELAPAALLVSLYAGGKALRAAPGVESPGLLAPERPRVLRELAREWEAGGGMVRGRGRRGGRRGPA